MTDRITFLAESVEFKKSKNDRVYARVKMSPGGWASAWHDSDRKLLQENPGGTFKADVKQDGDFRNLENLELAQPGAESDSKPSSNGGMTKEEWDAKERREAFRIAWAVVYRAERDNGESPKVASDRAFHLAGLVVSAAIGYAQPPGDEPF